MRCRQYIIDRFCDSSNKGKQSGDSTGYHQQFGYNQYIMCSVAFDFAESLTSDVRYDCAMLSLETKRDWDSDIWIWYCNDASLWHRARDKKFNVMYRRPGRCDPSALQQIALRTRQPVKWRVAALSNQLSQQWLTWIDPQLEKMFTAWAPQSSLTHSLKSNTFLKYELGCPSEIWRANPLDFRIVHT